MGNDLSFFSSIIIGVLSSLLASSFFLAALFLLKPRIEISDEIADQTESTDHQFAFKLINKSRFQAYDISIEAFLVTKSQVPGGTINRQKEILLRRSHLLEIGPYRNNDQEAHYAFRVVTLEDLRTLWSSDTQFIRLSVVSRHALSGFSSVQSIVFHTKGQIKKGKHGFGKCLSVSSVA